MKNYVFDLKITTCSNLFNTNNNYSNKTKKQHKPKIPLKQSPKRPFLIKIIQKTKKFHSIFSVSKISIHPKILQNYDFLIFPKSHVFFRKFWRFLKKKVIFFHFLPRHPRSPRHRFDKFSKYVIIELSRRKNKMKFTQALCKGKLQSSKLTN